MKHPLLTPLRNLYLYLVVWAVIASMHLIVLLFNQQIGLWWSLKDSLVFNALFAALGLCFWYTCKYISLEKKSVQRVLTSHLSASMLVSLVWVGASHTFLTQLLAPELDAQPFTVYKLFLDDSLVWRMLIGVLFYFVLASFYYLTIYSYNLREQTLKRAEMKVLVHQAELKSLKFQINPHFIFNSLNSINSLTQTAPEKAGEMTVKLADYLRYTLSHNERQKYPLSEELNSARLYLDIEKIRFGDKLQYVEDIQNGCLDYPVPNMILQPLMENAIKYGVYESLDQVTIRFSCRPYGDYLHIAVENNFDPEAVPSKGEGIGLKNIQARLQRMYEQNDLLEIDKQPEHFKVNLYIPKAETSVKKLKQPGNAR